MLILAADVGGTKIDLALASADPSGHTVLVRDRRASREASHLEEVLAQFLAKTGSRPDLACLAVAGPVVGAAATVTNLGWSVDAGSLGEALGIPRVVLLNDLEAVATAIPHLDPHDLYPLGPHASPREGHKAIIAPGTGLGEAFLVWTGEGYVPVASEGAHADFAPGTSQEVALLQWLGMRYGHVSWERVASGMALPDLYRFMRAQGRSAAPGMDRRVASLPDPAPFILEAASADPPCPASLAAVEQLAAALAAEAGNLCLKVLAKGGVFIAGGLAGRIQPFLESEAFLERFRGKGRFSAFLEDVPLFLVVHPQPALLGALRRGLREACASA